MFRTRSIRRSFASGLVCRDELAGMAIYAVVGGGLVKLYIGQIVGKEIANVVAVESDREPRGQVYLIFTDGTTSSFMAAI